MTTAQIWRTIFCSSVDAFSVSKCYEIAVIVSEMFLSN